MLAQFGEVEGDAAVCVHGEHAVGLRGEIGVTELGATLGADGMIRDGVPKMAAGGWDAFHLGLEVHSDAAFAIGNEDPFHAGHVFDFLKAVRLDVAEVAELVLRDGAVAHVDAGGFGDEFGEFEALTGQLGDVMKESCSAAMSYVRSRGPLFGLDKEYFANVDVHIHFPEGAIPKDGPSAGCAITTSIVSACMKIPVRRTVAMTGEVTLRGRVLAIGGLKEKTLAAHRGGIRTIICPKENEKDIKDIPKEVLRELRIILVDHVDQVLVNALDIKNPKELFKNRPERGSGVKPQHLGHELQTH